MSLILSCDSGYNAIDNVEFKQRESGCLAVSVTRTKADADIFLSKQDVERLYEYLGKHLGKKEESSVKAKIASIEDIHQFLEMDFECTVGVMDSLSTSYDSNDHELHVTVRSSDTSSSIYLNAEDALTLANNIIKAFGGRQ